MKGEGGKTTSLPVIGEGTGEGVSRRVEVPFEGPGASYLKDRERVRGRR